MGHDIGTGHRSDAGRSLVLDELNAPKLASVTQVPASSRPSTSIAAQSNRSVRAVPWLLPSFGTLHDYYLLRRGIGLEEQEQHLRDTYDRAHPRARGKR